MLSYQHIYHAGNAADVHKHIWLIRVLLALRKGGKPLFWLDTHGGRGLYDLAAPEAQKLGEYREGYLKFREEKRREKNLPDEMKTYFSLIDQVNKKRKGLYPGSAYIAASLLSPKDTLIACDMHKGEVEHLKRHLQKFPQARVLKESGYDILAREIPSTGPGGVLIDPSYEVKTEYAQVAEAVIAAHARWPQGVYMVWYPILKAANHKGMVAALSALPSAQVDEVQFRDPASEGKGMAGSGMIVIGA